MLCSSAPFWFRFMTPWQAPPQSWSEPKPKASTWEITPATSHNLHCSHLNRHLFIPPARLAMCHPSQTHPHNTVMAQADLRVTSTSPQRLSKQPFWLFSFSFYFKTPHGSTQYLKAPPYTLRYFLFFSCNYEKNACFKNCFKSWIIFKWLINLIY